MALFQSQNGKLHKIQNKGFRLEKDLQQLIQTKPEALLDLQMVKQSYQPNK